MVVDNENNELFVPMEGFGETLEISSKEERKNRKGLLNWFKLRRDSGSATLTSSDGYKSSLTKSFTAPSTPLGNGITFPSEQRISNSMLAENVPADLSSVGHGEFPSDSLPVEEAPLVSTKNSDHVDLLREQLKILSGEVALHTSVLKRLTEGAGRSELNKQIEIEIKVVNGDIKVKKQQIASLERQIAHSMSDSQGKFDNLELSPSYTEILEQLNEKAFELEVKTADNRIMQDQLDLKASKCEELQETIAYLKEQLSQALEANELLSESIILQQKTGIGHEVGLHVRNEKPLSRDVSEELLGRTLQSEVDELKQRLCELTEANSQLETRNQSLLEESTYAKGLASAAGVELKALSEEVTKLMKHNEKLASELASTRNSTQRRLDHGPRGARRDSHIKRHDPGSRRDINGSYEREQALEAMLMEKDQREAELQKKIELAKQKEAFLEGELANLWVLVAKLKNAPGNNRDDLDAVCNNIMDHDPGDDHGTK